MKKYILIATNHGSLNFLNILSNDSSNRFQLKNPKRFFIYTLWVECHNILDRKMYHDRKPYGFYLPGSNFSKS
jgi:hypothetical protein